FSFVLFLLDDRLTAVLEQKANKINCPSPQSLCESVSMSPADISPKPLPSGGPWHSPSGPVSPAHPSRNEIAPCHSRDGTLPSAVPAPSSPVTASEGRTSRQEVFAALRA